MKIFIFFYGNEKKILVMIYDVIYWLFEVDHLVFN